MSALVLPERREDKVALLALLRDRYAGYATGELPMSTCCGGSADALLAAKRALALANGETPGPAAELADSGITEPAVVRMEFTGNQRGAVSYLGRPSGRAYLGGNNPFDKFIDADPRDVAHLESLGVWRVVPGQRPAAPPPPPAPIAPAPTVEARPERPIADMAPELAANEAAVNTAAAAMARTQRGRKVA